MRIKIVLLTALFLMFSSIGFAQSRTMLTSAHSSDQATAQEKMDLSQLILKDKQVQEDGVSTEDVAKGINVKKVDLNNDGQPEYIVTLEALPICGAHANCPDWVYRKSGSEYQLLLRTFGQQLLLEKASTNKFRDLRSEGASSAFETDFSIYKFDGSKYRAKACYSRTYSAKGRKPKIVLIKCQENE
jgi:hypothetical protein